MEIFNKEFILTLLTWLSAFTLVLIGGFTFFIRVLKRKNFDLDRKVAKKTAKIEEKNLALKKEQAKVDKLLKNLFPAEIIKDLKENEKPLPKHYSSASVMFADIKDFTSISDSLRPKLLVQILDKYFSKFDDITEEFELEKIKTIGDCYMCTGGLPSRNKINPVQIVMAALKIQEYMIKTREISIKKGEDYFDLKIGIHTGECVAGVVGKSKPVYDVWGKTVNVAQRMQETCVVGKVNVSGATKELIAPFFETTYRGKIPAKNMGELNMYFVERIKPEFSADDAGKVPNEMFWRYVRLHLRTKIRYQEMEKYVLKYLGDNLPDNLYYHGLHHTVAVSEAAEQIALAEEIEGEDLFVIKTAALLHDIGFTQKYKNNEAIGAEIAAEILPDFGFNEGQIEMIQKLILATKVPQKPKTKLEKVLCDADLFYLGKKSFHSIADTLRQEFLERGIVKNQYEWDKLQIKFLSEHFYHTTYARTKARANKLMRLDEIKERIKVKQH
jgi:putative nucleotidyltransferase with HDIG domain